nr:uncharacterized protein LOC117691281 [Crassostrea gigas]
MPIVMTLLLFIFYKVNINFTSVYRNFTNRNTLDVCISYTIAAFPNLPVITTLFDGVTCWNLNSSYKINKNLFVSDTLEYCDDNMEILNVTTELGKFEHFCDLQNKTMTIEMTIKVNTTSASYSVTATEMLTSEFSNLHQTTNGVFVQQTNSEISELKTSTYVLAPAAGVFLISCIVTLVVRRKERTQAREREKSYETITTGGQTQYINMTENTHHYDVIGYTSERMQDSCS